VGISRCGALDKPALVIANLLVGNGANAAALEITLGQVDIQFERSGWFALTGAACEAKLDGEPVWVGWRTAARPGSIWCSKPAAWHPQLSGGGGGLRSEGAGFALPI
jgi:allophanate hydrolase subunit 2